MTLVKGIFRVLFLLLMQSAIWSICVCKAIKKEELSPKDDDLFGPYNSQKPFWPPTLRPPLVWPTFSWTYRPHDFHDSHDTNSSGIPVGLKVFIFILISIVGLIALICKYVCKADASDSTSESATTVHSPPQRISPTTLDSNSPQIQYRVMPPYAGSSTSRNRNTQQFQSRTVPMYNGTSNTYNAADKPPSYSDVVTSDLTDSIIKFPDVSVAAPGESPPPKYEKGDLPKF